MNSLLQKLVLGGSVTALVAAMPVSASFAQGNGDVEQVVVSASRISIAGFDQPTPVSMLSSKQLEAAGYTNVQDAMRELPQVLVAPSNISRNSGGATPAAGANYVDIRGLDAVRTLTLLDGQRVAAAALNAGGADVTSFPPSMLISRIDVVTGGASAAWGSDAVAGVVNFVLNKNYSGFKANLQAGETTDSLVRELSGQAAWGRDILNGRGHVEFGATASNNPDMALITDEHWFRNPYWVTNPNYVKGVNSQQIVAYNVGLANATLGGIINASPAGVAGPGITVAAANALKGTQFVGAGSPQLVNYGNITKGAISNGGSLTTADSQVSGQFISAPRRSYTFFGYGRYKLTDNIQASVQVNLGNFLQKGSAGTAQQPTIPILADNPYIPVAVKAAMTAGGIPSFTLGSLQVNNFDGHTVTGRTFFQQATGSLGPILNIVKRNFVRGVISLDGTLGDDWSWTAYIQHSNSRTAEFTPNNAIVANLTAAEDAVAVTAANRGTSGLPLGSVVCRSTLTGVRPVVNTNTAQTGCIPLNVFGEGVASPAAIAYIIGATSNSQNYSRSSLSQDVAEASMQGTLPWELPAGKVAVAFGAGYRKEMSFEDAPTQLPGVINFMGGTQNPYAQGGPLTTVPHRSYNVMEGFAQVDAPILENNIVNSLAISMAGRLTSYSTSGLVETWKLGVTSQINDDIKVRATWSTDIRAPSLYELYNPGTVSSNQAIDPKTHLNVPVAQYTTGSANLLPETARTWSAGVVLTPSFLPGLSFSADWYNISIVGKIASLTREYLLGSCDPLLSNPGKPGQNGSLSDPICALIDFNGAGGAMNAVHLTTYNIGTQTTSGLDLQANYTMDLWDGTLALSSTANLNDENTSTTLGGAPNDAAGQVGGGTQALGPKWRGTVSATYVTGPYSITAQSRWAGTAVQWQDGNTGNLATAATADLYDPIHFHVPFNAYLDLRASYSWDANMQIYGAVDDALNTPPPLVPGTTGGLTPGSKLFGAYPQAYDLLGRKVRLGVRFTY